MKKKDEQWRIESVKDVSCLQPNQISQGLYKCSPMAKRLLAYTIANLKMIKWNLDNQPTYEVNFKPVQFAKNLGLQRIGVKQQQLIKNALEELQSSYIAIDTGNMFMTFAWVTDTLYSPKDKLIHISLNPKLGEALLEWRKGFTTIQLVEMGRLQSFYAMRFYEIALSFRGFEGKSGNKKNHWYFEMSIKKIREVFQLDNNEYTGRMNNFTTKVVENPIQEVNEKTELTIRTEKVKEGKTVLGFRFHCTMKTESVKITKTDDPELRTEKAKINDEQKELERYKRQYPEEWANTLAIVQAQEYLPGMPRLSSYEEFQTLKILKEQGL